MQQKIRLIGMSRALEKFGQPLGETVGKSVAPFVAPAAVALPAAGAANLAARSLKVKGRAGLTAGIGGLGALAGLSLLKKPVGSAIGSAVDKTVKPQSQRPPASAPPVGR